jgi:UDP-N-acetylmuramoyl-tripeptide--D-alanyl-D-alanine ligase
MMDLAGAAAAVGGTLRGANATFARVTTDSRDVAAGDLFVALRGERFDGHDFVAQAMAGGAVGAIVAEARAAAFGTSVVAVDDPLAALGRLAHAWRARFAIPIVVVVGSNGKTTVKEMTAGALGAHYGADAVLATRGNLNNAIGLPLTLLRLSGAHRAAVIELGMNHRGETAELAAIAKPTIALVNNAQREHQEFMRSVAEVADEHADAILALPSDGIAVVNTDDPHVDAWRRAAARAGVRTIGFGTHPSADVRATIAMQADASTLALVTPAGEARVALAVPGRPMAQNALAACAAALAAGATLDAIRRGLEAFRPVAGRLAPRVAASGALVIDDSYNANPDSVRAAIDVLARARGARWLVLGDMGEVGSEGPAFHREIGEYARTANLDRVFTVGTLAATTAAAFGAGARHFDDVPALARAVASEAGDGVTVLVKGSRFMRMERVVAALSAEPAVEGR